MAKIEWPITRSDWERSMEHEQRIVAEQNLPYNIVIDHPIIDQFKFFCLTPMSAVRGIRNSTGEEVREIVYASEYELDSISPINPETDILYNLINVGSSEEPRYLIRMARAVIRLF